MAEPAIGIVRLMNSIESATAASSASQFPAARGAEVLLRQVEELSYETVRRQFKRRAEAMADEALVRSRRGTDFVCCLKDMLGLCAEAPNSHPPLVCCDEKLYQ